MSTKVKLLKNTTSNVGNLFYRSSTKCGGSTCMLTTRNTNVYDSAAKALKRKTDTDSAAMFMIKNNVAVHILGTSNSGNSIIVKIKTGSKVGYVYLGNVTNTNPNSGNPAFKFNSPAPYANLAVYKTTTLRAIGLTNSDLRIGNVSTYANNLNNGNELNEDSIVAGTLNTGSTSDATENADSKSASAVNTMNSNSSSASSGDINVTYEFAVKVNPAYAWNIADHLGGIEEYKGEYKGINYRNLRSIFGTPYQFLPTTDCRVGSGYTDNIEMAGYEFAEKIISRMPLLYITPGNTSFMGGSRENARKTLLGSLSDKIHGDWSSGDTALTQTPLETMLEEYNGKLYTIMPAYVEYFSYVNPLCRAGAIFLDIADTTLDSDGIVANSGISTQSVSFANMNWGISEGQAYEIWEEEETTLAEGVEDLEETTEEKAEQISEEITEPKKAKYEEDYSEYFKKDETLVRDFEKRLYYGNAIAFYINSDASFQDSFTNETTESSLSTVINGLSDKAREIQFLLGTASEAVGDAFDKVDGTLSDIKSQINSIVDKVAGGNSIFSTIANSVKTIVSGGRMLFPQIWLNSTFSKSYSISIKLNTPSTDRVSWWLNIYVPLCHLMGLVLPRSEYVNSYTTPFIVKAFYKGMFNIDMGIITEMTFNKGKEGSWTKDGLPTVVDVSFTIQDLYSAMGMTSTAKMFKGTTLQNVAEMDYVANLCGININEPDVFRMVNLFAAFNMTNKVYDFLPNLSLGVEKYISTSVVNAYNNFWF